jgi:lipopolysaccharide export system protein LptC
VFRILRPLRIIEPVTGFQGTIGSAAALPARREKAYAKARRHSRVVRLFKWAIPLGSLLAVIGVMLVVIYDPFRTIKGLTVGPVTVSGTQVTMESPKLSGFKNDTRPYQVTATAATQDVRQPNLVELKNLRARLATNDAGGIANLEAATGVLDTQKEQLQLKQDVLVRTDEGQTVNLQSAFVDFKAGTVVSDEPVTVSLNTGTIQAKGLRVSDNGKLLRFKGRVHAEFRTTGETTPSAAAPDAPPPTASTSP